MKKSNLIFIKETIIFIIVLFAASITLVHASAPTGEVTKSGNFSYQKLADGSYQILQYSGNDKKVIIPDKYSDEKITAISNQAFSDANALEEIELHEDINYVASDVFKDNRYLKRIIVPEGTADKFTEVLSSSKFASNHRVSLFENNQFSVSIDNVKLNQEDYNTAIHYQKQLGDSLDITIDMKQTLKYIYENNKWEVSEEVVTINSDINKLTWYVGVDETAVIQNGNRLYIASISEDDIGYYTLKLEDEVLLQFELQIAKEDKTSIITGINLPFAWSDAVVLLSAVGLAVYILKRRKDTCGN